MYAQGVECTGKGDLNQNRELGGGTFKKRMWNLDVGAQNTQVWLLILEILTKGSTQSLPTVLQRRLESSVLFPDAHFLK